MHFKFSDADFLPELRYYYRLPLISSFMILKGGLIRGTDEHWTLYGHLALACMLLDV